MGDESLDDFYDECEGDENNYKENESSPPMSEKTMYTERRRKIEDKLEMLRIKRELGLEDDFTF